MNKEPYKIIDVKPSWTSKLGSGIVAVGSVATAIVITVPGLPGYEILSQAQESQDSQGTEAQPETTVDTAAANSVSLVNANSVDPVSSEVGVQAQTLGEVVNQDPAPSEQVLSLPGIDSGNTSSPTPYGSSEASGNNSSGGTAAGNTSSPTPGGSEYEDDDDDEYEDDDDDDEYEDDDDEYEDDDDDEEDDD